MRRPPFLLITMVLALSVSVLVHAADDFVLVTGRGQAFTKGDLLKDARDKTAVYEHQEEEAGSQTVRVWGGPEVLLLRGSAAAPECVAFAPTA